MKKLIAAVSAAVMLFGAVAGVTACGEDAGNGHEHVFDEGEITTAPTCTVEGIKTFRCTVEGCTESYTERVGKVDHIFTGAWVEVDEDLHAKKCANCDEVGEETEAHRFVEDSEKLIPATCHSDGKKTYVCEDCGAEKTEAITERPAHDFDNGEWVEAGEGHAKKCADCEAVDENIITHTYSETLEHNSDGHWQVCEDCGYKTEPVEHKWDEGTVTTPPAFMQDGEKTYTCTDCGETMTEAVDALTSANHAEEFTTTAENNPWGYGKMDVTGWDGDNFQYNLLPATGTTQDAYTGDGIEIKGGWLSGGGSYISYTVTADVTVKFDITAKQVDGGKRMDVRTVFGSEARYHGGYDGGNMAFSEEYTLSAGDTVYIVFTPKGEDEGFDQTDFTIEINKIA